MLTCAVLSQNPLPPLDEPILVVHHVPNLDDVACDAVLENLDGLGCRHGASQQFDQIARIENRSWIKCLGIELANPYVQGEIGAAYFSRRLHCHGALHEI